MEAGYKTRYGGLPMDRIRYKTRQLLVNIGMALDGEYRHGGFWWTLTQFFFLGMVAC